MNSSLYLASDPITERIKRLIGEVLRPTGPECLKWWRKQPVNFFEDTIDELDRACQAATSPAAINAAFTFAETELRMYVRFYLRAAAWVEGIIIMPKGEQLSPTVVPDHLLDQARKAGVLQEYIK